MTETETAATGRLAVCAIVKDLGKYLEEWIGYHLALGFDEIILYDNDTTDELSPGIFSRLEESGHGRVINWPRASIRPGLSPQIEAYTHCFATFGKEFDWILVIDADEFLNLKVHGTVQDLVAEHQSSGSIGFFWRIFGDSGHRHYEERAVMDRFVRAAEKEYPGHAHIKAMSRPATVEKLQIHYAKLKREFLLHTASGVPLSPNKAKYPHRIEHRVAQINHYYGKTLEEFEEKRARGNANVASDHPRYIRQIQMFHKLNRNEVADTSILERRDAAGIWVRKIFGDERADRLFGGGSDISYE